MTIWGMRISYWITKATDTNSEYVILIALPRQQPLRKRSLMLRSYARCMYGSWTLLEIRTLKYIHHRHHKHQGLDRLIRSVSRVTVGRAVLTSLKIVLLISCHL